MKKPKVRWLLQLGFLLAALFSMGCAHYPPNHLLNEVSPEGGYRLRNSERSDRSDELLLVLTFSGGGTRAAALSYGVLEQLAQTEIIQRGRKRYLLDEVDAISAVSGGSFTAAYYGLFGWKIFEDFETRFLKKNIQKDLFMEAIEAGNWFRLWSSTFGRSDLAAEYYDKNIFEGKTFGDILAQGNPLILINATDLALGSHFTFTQDMFDLICSDVARYPVSRAVAASSAVPGILTPITLYNYAGTCNYDPPEWMKKALDGPPLSRRRTQLAQIYASYLDSKKRPYIHLVDGGPSDNLGLRGAIDRLTPRGDIWSSLQYMRWENTRKVVIILVNAQKETDTGSDRLERTLTSGQVLKSITNFPITRFNFETIELFRENARMWIEEIRSRRCGAGKEEGAANAGTVQGACADIDFYLIEVDFESLPDKAERAYFTSLPTSFHLSFEEVDLLRAVGRRVLINSPEFKRLLADLK
ncbi:MAG: patatin-like phospholipase family protein [Syntrophaceae bacterium]|nr:patatin-like phospholipase family protein [Syntrophaceae bacterium]